MVTIMAIWNTMMGSSLLAVPWAIKSSGLAMGFGIVVLMTIISYYTAYIIIDAFCKHNSTYFFLILFTRNLILFIFLISRAFSPLRVAREKCGKFKIV